MLQCVSPLGPVTTSKVSAFFVNVSACAAAGRATRSAAASAVARSRTIATTVSSVGRQGAGSIPAHGDRVTGKQVSLSAHRREDRGAGGLAGRAALAASRRGQGGRPGRRRG